MNMFWYFFVYVFIYILYLFNNHSNNNHDSSISKNNSNNNDSNIIIEPVFKSPKWLVLSSYIISNAPNFSKVSVRHVSKELVRNCS